MRGLFVRSHEGVEIKTSLQMFKSVQTRSKYRFAHILQLFPIQYITAGITAAVHAIHKYCKKPPRRVQ